MTLELPDGEYPFIHERFPLSEMEMMEAPPELEALFKSQAEVSGVVLARDAVVELVCKMPDGEPEVRFMIYWPGGQDLIHVLAPKNYGKGRA